MKHRTYGGKILYLTDGIGEMEREWFTVTVYGDGSRTLRARCEMDDDPLLRDVTYAVGPDWRPPRGDLLKQTYELVEFNGQGVS